MSTSPQLLHSTRSKPAATSPTRERWRAVTTLITSRLSRVQRPQLCMIKTFNCQIGTRSLRTPSGTSPTKLKAHMYAVPSSGACQRSRQKAGYRPDKRGEAPRTHRCPHTHTGTDNNPRGFSELRATGVQLGSGALLMLLSRASLDPLETKEAASPMVYITGFFSH